jgi:hypothetical protein
MCWPVAAAQNGRPWKQWTGERSFGAVYRADGSMVVELLGARPWPGTALQVIGDGLLTALSQCVGAAAVLAEECAGELRDRGWEGDDVLAEQLEAQLGHGPTPMLRPLPVDLDELATVLEGDPLTGEGRIDLRTGEVWPAAAVVYGLESGELDADDGDDACHWLIVDNTGSRPGYRDMQHFIDTVADAELADRLTDAGYRTCPPNRPHPGP